MKRILITLVVALFTFTINAQTTVSLVAGINSSTTSINSSLSEMVAVMPIQHATWGLTVDQRLDKNLSLTSGILSKKKGFKMEESTGVNLLGMDLPIGAKVINTIDYIEVPLILKYNASTSSGVEPYIGVGPSLAYARKGTLDTKVSAAIFDLNVTSTSLSLSSPDYNRTQVVGHLVGGIKIPYGGGNWIAEIGYSKSFTDLVSDDFQIDAGGKHSDLQFSIGYGISF